MAAKDALEDASGPIVVYGASGYTGKLISAVWDDWASFPVHLDELSKSDVYTLRRIVAKDRGFGWGDK